MSLYKSHQVMGEMKLQKGRSHRGSNQGGEDTGLRGVSQQQEDPEQVKELASAEAGILRDPGVLRHPSSVPSAGQKADLVHWGHSSYATLLGCEVDVLGGHGAGHSEVLEDGGEEEE